MILLLDIGNTRLKWGRVSADGVQYGGALPHGGDFQTLVAQLPVTRPDQVWVAHVLGAAQEPALVAGLTQRYGVAPQVARTRGVSPGLRVAYTDPARLGVDRWLGMLATRQHTDGAFVVASAGTALTLDVVDDGGNHLGGFIAPGLQTALNATLGATRFQTGTLTNAFRANLGRDTEACVREGAVLSCLGALDRGLTLAPDRASRWITGGDAPVLLPHLGHWSHRPHLTLEGLRVLALEAQGEQGGGSFTRKYACGGRSAVPARSACRPQYYRSCDSCRPGTATARPDRVITACQSDGDRHPW